MNDGATHHASDRTDLPQVELEIIRGRARQRRRRIEVPVFLIGSAPDCDLVLADNSFPEVHTYIYVNKQGVSVRRLGEGPELRVNGNSVQTARLVEGERLQLGSYEFAVHVALPPDGDIADDEPSSFTAETELLSAPPAGVAAVLALLADIRATLRVEAGLKLYIEPEFPWAALATLEPTANHKATA
jgi:predicted component of type VI protein secretion system